MSVAQDVHTARDWVQERQADLCAAAPSTQLSWVLQHPAPSSTQLSRGAAAPSTQPNWAHTALVRERGSALQC